MSKNRDREEIEAGLSDMEDNLGESCFGRNPYDDDVDDDSGYPRREEEDLRLNNDFLDHHLWEDEPWYEERSECPPSEGMQASQITIGSKMLSRLTKKKREQYLDVRLGCDDQRAVPGAWKRPKADLSEDEDLNFN